MAFYIIFGILMFGVLIFIHEFGHFIAAKKCGVGIYEFAIGMGPKLFSKRVKTELFTHFVSYLSADLFQCTVKTMTKTPTTN